MNDATDRAHSPFVTALAWLAIACSCVALLAVLFRLGLMLLAIGPIMLLLPLNVVLIAVPAAGLAIGIGLLNRRDWARIAMIIVLLAVMLLTIVAFLWLDSDSETEIFLGSGETSRLVFPASSAFWTIVSVIFCAFGIYLLCREDVKNEFRNWQANAHRDLYGAILVKMRQGVSDQRKKIAGAASILIAAVVFWLGFPLSGALFVVIGVSLILDIRIWRS